MNPPSYDQSQAMSNPNYAGPNPTYPNTESAEYQKNYQTNYVAAVQPPGASVHVVTPQVTPIMVAPRVLGPFPSNVYCHKCNQDVTTSVNKESGAVAWISCGVLCLLGCWFGCCLIPFCVDACQDFYHNCPRCNTFLGKYSKFN